ncbi:response regulator [Pseudoduganella aquatica]|uniref:Response regulator n=1 Tax=Pseudoduganella aquatica TaxID=2660641 RepID=A0A7X4HEW6_9BURK|nr:two-component system response regulator [Pseudoduganella aquatica]MYN09694.1 response regulator [Pseudoduganella aquatica]
MNAKQTARPVILIVDDTPDNITLLSSLLKDKYTTKVAKDGATALQIVEASKVDLILLDVMMPGMDGYETCRRLKQNPASADVPVLFLTAKSQPEDEAMGLRAGAADYLTKPISPPILFARVATHLKLRAANLSLKAENAALESLVQERTGQLSLLHDATVMAMATMAETRDSETGEKTGNHIRRTQNYVAALARKLQSHPRFAADLTDENITLLYKSVPLHDIGKAGMPEAILLKPGKLDQEEFEIMKLHAVRGRDTIRQVEEYIGGSNGFLTYAREIAHSHQEKWDGSGYPEKLAGEAIPLSARLMAVADVYDALISRRLYKLPYSHAEAVEIMQDGRGSHFDPDILDAFLAIEASFADIAAQFRDAENGKNEHAGEK